MTFEVSDPCPVCRFDGRHYADIDVDGTLRGASARWDWLVEGLPPDRAVAIAGLRAASDEAVTDAIARGPAAAAARRRAAHIAGHALHLAGRVLWSDGARPPAAEGTVTGLFVSGGGVPKGPIPVAEIGYRGVRGDRQASRKHHGRVWQALCLWSADVVDDLAMEGHPIAPGRAGENVSITGIDWSALRPGLQLGIGEVLVELTAYATPCTKNARLFADRDFHRILHDRHPGSSRIYASVLADGTVQSEEHTSELQSLAYLVCRLL